VVLELLIIIVERDEAEEGLHLKQKETMRIVQSILSQLQSGAGTEGINTRPQDEITIPPAGVNIKEVLGTDIKSWRKYIVEVGVTDVSASVKRKEGESEKEYFQRIKTLVKLSNVEELEYQVFYNTDNTPGVTPSFPSDKDLLAQGITGFEEFTEGQKVTAADGTQWEFLALRKLDMDNEATFNQLDMSNISPDDFRPVYPKETEIQVGPTFQPRDVSADSVFYYNHDLSINSTQGKEKNKRAFVVQFQPPDREGWYKLRFASKTNKILGIRGEYQGKELDDDATVNIGTVQLSVKELRKVHKSLKSELEKYELPDVEILTKEADLEKFDAGLRAAADKASTESEANDIQSKIKLYGYIAKLIAPGMSVHFDQNKGYIEFDIRVIKPKPQMADPIINVANKLSCFDAVEPVFMFGISPYQGDGNRVSGYVVDENGAQVATVNYAPVNDMATRNAEPIKGGERRYQGTLNKKLPEGSYTIKLTHSINGSNKPAESNIALSVFKTGLTPGSMKDVAQKLDFMTYYGWKMIVNVEPASQGAIKPEEFKIYVSTDAQSQPTVISGLAVTLNDNIEYTPDAKEVKFRVVWEQPHTGRMVDIYPQKTIALKQEEASINTNVVTECSGTSSKVKVRVTGLTVTSPTSGDKKGTNANVQVSVLSTEIAEGLSGYSVAVEPTVDKTGEGVYEMEFELSGKLPAGEKKLRGTVNILLRATAVNAINGVAADPNQTVVPVRIDYEPDSRGGAAQGGRRRR
jgi:hypothetical protein